MQPSRISVILVCVPTKRGIVFQSQQLEVDRQVRGENP